MDFKTVGEFHWLTKIVILLTGLIFVLMLTVFAATLLGPLDLAYGLALILPPLVSISLQLFKFILIIIVLCIIGAGIKTGIEKNRDTMLVKNDVSELKAEIKLLNQSAESIETKVDNISDILEKVSE